METNAMLETIKKLIAKEYKFTIVYSPESKTATIISVTKVDFIKRDFPEFYIYLNFHNQKCVERVFNLA